MGYRFNEFEFNEESKTLSRDGIAIGLNRTQFRALWFLLEHSGTRKTREEIARFVWEKDEAYLNKNDNDVDKLISALRGKLNDDSRKPTIIRTVPKSEHPDKGYILIADVIRYQPLHNERKLDLISNFQLSMKQLNSLQDVKVYGLIESVPAVIDVGEFDIEKKLSSKVDERAAYLRLEHRDDSVLAVVDSEPDIFNIPLNFNARLLRYSGLSVLREIGPPPFVLSSNVVLVSPKNRSIIVDLRSSSVDTYKSRLHTFGGAYEHTKDSNDLRTTAIREITEETKVSISIKKDVPILLCQEISNRFLQVVFLGVQVADDELVNLSASWESHSLRHIPFDSLEKELSDTQERAWVPTGRAHILAWLACGAPGAPSGPLFNGLTAQELFSQIIEDVESYVNETSI